MGPAGETTAPVEKPVDARELAANRRGWLKVLDAPALVRVCHLAGTLQQIHRESKLSKAAWERDIAPAIEQYLRYVQLLPASEAHHHAHVGGLAAHTIEVMHAAIAIRNGYLLPRGGAADAIDAQRDHWTYAVILAALLHDIGKLATDLRVELADRSDGPPRPWLPVAGDLLTAGAVEYQVRFAPRGERDYGAHRRMALVLAPRIVPATALAFVAREPSVMRALEGMLSGEDASGVLTEIVRRADQRSAASNLQQGPRNRFAAATAVPLVERLMEAVRRLLRQGGLPLNRDGAAGWVAGGAIWFVAKRLADAAREEIARSDPDDSAQIPGPSKNDRLFDAWQDYGLLERNPDTGQAIWYVEVRGTGYAHAFAMLKFPLDKLFDDPRDYPPAFDGELVVQPSRHVRGHTEPSSVSAEGEGGGGEAMCRPSPTTRKKPDVPPPRPAHAASKRSDAGPAQPAKAATRPDHEAPGNADAEDDYLTDDDSAGAVAAAIPLGSSPVVPRCPPRARTDRPVTPYVHVPPPPSPDDDTGAAGRAPSDAALRFMAWLQQGLADGSIAYNEAGAPVHFVEEGMALVSPRTFREFASRYGDDGGGSESGATPAAKLGTGIQRQVIKARWHLVGPGNANVHHYSVLGRGGKPVGKLAAVVIKHPERWVNPVPPPNPNLVPFHEKASPRASDSTEPGQET